MNDKITTSWSRQRCFLQPLQTTKMNIEKPSGEQFFKKIQVKSVLIFLKFCLFVFHSLYSSSYIHTFFQRSKQLFYMFHTYGHCWMLIISWQSSFKLAFSYDLTNSSYSFMVLQDLPRFNLNKKYIRFTCRSLFQVRCTHMSGVADSKCTV